MNQVLDFGIPKSSSKFMRYAVEFAVYVGIDVLLLAIICLSDANLPQFSNSYMYPYLTN